MAFTAATLQASVTALLTALIKAQNEVEYYLDNCNNPGRLAQTDAALTVVLNAITAVRA